MKHINELEKILSNLFNWHKSRIGRLTQMIQALFFVKRQIEVIVFYQQGQKH